MRSLTPIALPVILLLSVLFLYGPYLAGDFQFDDHAYILESAEIRDVKGCLQALGNHFFRPDRMLVTLSFAVNHALHGFNEAGFRLVNTVLHGINALLVFWLVRHLFHQSRPELHCSEAAGQWIPGLAALLFALHPVAVHSVSYVTQRHGLLATLFYLVGMLSYIEARKAFGARRLFWVFSLLIAYWGAVHSKPMALTLPLALAAYELLVRQHDREALRHKLFLSIPLLLVSAAVLTGYAWSAGLFAGDAGLAGFRSVHLWPVWQHMLTESLVFLHYWKILLLPLPGWLSGDHYFPVITAVNLPVIFAWLAHLLIISFGVWGYRAGRPLIAFGIAWFYLTLVPPYFALPIQDVMVDYKTYLPAVGLACLLAESGRHLYRSHGGRTVIVCGMLVAVFWLFGAVERNRVFATEESFWTDVIEKYPMEPRPYNNRGLAHHRQGRYRQAIADYQYAMNLAPGYGLAHANIGDSYREVGAGQQALEHYLRYSQIHPEDGDGPVRVANIHADRGEWREAVGYYRQAVAREPDNSGALYNLGLGLSHLAEYDEALQAFARILRLTPDHQAALAAIGAVYYQRGAKERAKDYFERALALDPFFPDALYNLAVYYLSRGMPDEARLVAERLIEIDTTRGQALLAHPALQ